MKLGIHGLPLRSAVIAKRRRRLRVLAATAALCVFGFIAGVTYEIWPHRADVVADVTSAFTSPAAAPTAAPAPTRPVYRHSIVPGGAYSRREVADAMRKDAVVAAHYRHVDVDKVHTKTVTAARAVYVSYRIGNQTYWTKDRVQLSPGETVLTDGETEIRARCGNLVSDNAQQPVAAEEPPLAALDEATPEPETGSSTLTGERGDDEGRLTHVPFMADARREGSSGFDGADPASGGPAPLDSPMWPNGGGGGASPYMGASTGANGTSLVAPLGGSQRNNSNGGGPNGGGPNGEGPNGGGPNGGDPNGGGPNGGGPNGGGPNGGGPNGGDEKDPPTDNGPHTTTGDSVTTTGGSLTTTTGNIVIDTTGDGGGDDDGEVPSVPEPGTLMLLTLGACGFAAREVRKRRRD